MRKVFGLLGALLLTSTALAQERASPTDGQTVPLFPSLKWGAKEKDLLAQKRLKKITIGSPGEEKIVSGLKSVIINKIDFSIGAEFGYIGKARVTGLSRILLTNFPCTTNILELDEFVTAAGFKRISGSSLTESFMHYFSDKDHNNEILVVNACPDFIGFEVYRTDGRVMP